MKNYKDRNSKRSGPNRRDLSKKGSLRRRRQEGSKRKREDKLRKERGSKNGKSNKKYRRDSSSNGKLMKLSKKENMTNGCRPKLILKLKRLLHLSKFRKSGRFEPQK